MEFTEKIGKFQLMVPPNFQLFWALKVAGIIFFSLDH